MANEFNWCPWKRITRLDVPRRIFPENSVKIRLLFLFINHMAQRTRVATTPLWLERLMGQRVVVELLLWPPKGPRCAHCVKSMKFGTLMYLYMLNDLRKGHKLIGHSFGRNLHKRNMAATCQEIALYFKHACICYIFMRFKLYFHNRDIMPFFYTNRSTLLFFYLSKSNMAAITRVT